jgi:hypothetical protein
MAFASLDLVPKLALNLSTRRTFETLSSSGPFQELISLASKHQYWANLGSLPFHFHQSLSLSSSLGTKAFDKLSTLVLMGKSEISASLGILQGKSFNSRVSEGH